MIFRVVIIHKTIFKVGSVKMVAELVVNRLAPMILEVWGLQKGIARSRFTFTVNGKREFVPRDLVSP